MLGVRQEVRRSGGATLVYVREAAASAIRFAAGGRYADAGKPEEPAANAVALRGGASEQRARVVGGRNDAVGACEAPGRIDEP